MTEPLRQRLETDMKSAMKSGDVKTRDTVRFLMAALKNAEIEKRGPLDDKEGETLLLQQAKRMTDSIEQYTAGNRPDLAEKEAEQLAILKRYLPAELTDEEVRSLVQDVLNEVGATSMKDMAKVMPLVIERAAGRSDGKRLSAAVRSALASGG